jgi:hypothetical protein
MHRYSDTCFIQIAYSICALLCFYTVVCQKWQASALSACGLQPVAVVCYILNCLLVTRIYTEQLYHTVWSTMLLKRQGGIGDISTNHIAKREENINYMNGLVQTVELEKLASDITCTVNTKRYINLYYNSTYSNLHYNSTYHCSACTHTQIMHHIVCIHIHILYTLVWLARFLL